MTIADYVKSLFEGNAIDHQCEEYDSLLNPDAVAVKWFKCKLCGRTRKEIVNKEVW